MNSEGPALIFCCARVVLTFLTFDQGTHLFCVVVSSVLDVREGICIDDFSI